MGISDILSALKDAGVWLIKKVVSFIITLFQPFIDGTVDAILGLLPVELSDEMEPLSESFLKYYDFFAYFIPIPYAFTLLMAYFNFLSLFWVYRKAMNFFGIVDTTKLPTT